ncbi:MAG: hypothetical protein OXL41_11820 [Nitrospinae bacterium]|nr:hypothetical protein [Nitrospinota bacterium]
MSSGILRLKASEQHIPMLTDGEIVFMTIPPDELLERLGVHTSLYAADEKGIFAVLNDQEKGHFFAVDRESGNFRWRVANTAGWVIAPPLIWGDLYIVGTSNAEMRREEKGGLFATVDWKRGGSVYAFGASDGAVHFWDEKTGVVRSTPREEDGVLIVEGEIRMGGFQNEEPWSSSAEVESRFSLITKRLTARRVRGDVPSGYFEGEAPPTEWV